MWRPEIFRMQPYKKFSDWVRSCEVVRPHKGRCGAQFERVSPLSAGATDIKRIRFAPHCFTTVAIKESSDSTRENFSSYRQRGITSSANSVIERLTVA